MARVFIGIGSNIGDRHVHLELARDALAQLPQTRLVAFSQTYESDADSPVPQGDFLNAVGELDTDLDPLELLAALQEIERDAGRRPLVQRVKWGPRTLDLDLLLYDQRIISTDELVVPHPMMHERWYVLKPLAEIAPGAVHPILEMTVGALLENVENSPRQHQRGSVDT